MILLRKIYYKVKPYTPRALRLWLRRGWAAWRRRHFAAIWPINPAAGKAPEGWAGWPDGKRFAFILTHDVESRVGVKRCPPLMELEMELGFRSAFNFVPEAYPTPPDLRDLLVRRGFEVAVHDLKHDGKLYDSRQAFCENARSINEYLREWKAVGFRSAFMLHRLEWHHDLNILYDASTFDTDPFEPQPEGIHTIFPFCVPGPQGGGYVELPYTLVQDFNLFVILRERSTDIWKQKLDWIAARGGMALMDVHPDYIAFGEGRPRTDEYPASRYREFLEWVKSNYAGQYWHALPRQVAAHVRQMALAPPDLQSRSEAGPAVGTGGVEASSSGR